ncbi:MAG: cobalamin-dependent protein [Deltaproteobacteria bacterium]|nr:MAG: cobalamin-dependent protein [Deltaproteobacteria bacterium]
MAGKLAKLLSDLKEPEALAFVEKALGQGVDPMDLLGQAKEGMNIVGQRFASEEYFIPDLVFSGEILKGIVNMLEPNLKKGEEEERLGKVVIGTVAGDIHDIGKDLVVFMLDVNGFEVFDLGIDVPVQKFVDTIKETGSRVVGLSGFLTLAFQSMKDTVEAINEAGLRNDVKIMIGGGQIDEQVKSFTGADAYGKDAMEAVTLTKGWIGG